MPIPSPYNFVALPERVATRTRQCLNVHDIPLRNGIGGWIDYELEATTPIYVRGPGHHKTYRDSTFAADCETIWRATGGHQPADRESSRGENFDDFRRFVRFCSLPDGTPVIPGTSIRGVIRSLVEILSASRIHPVSKRKYAVRDLHNRRLYGAWMTGGKQGSGFKPKVAAGWLQKSTDADGDKPAYRLIPCAFSRVEQEDLERFADGGVQLGREGPAKRKYAAWTGAEQPLELDFSIDPERKHTSHSQPLVYSRAKPVRPGAAPGATRGTLVFTGQPMDRGTPRKRRRKHMEFVFHSSREDRAVAVPSSLITDLEQTHGDELGKPGEALAHWLPQLRGGKRIPVFYLAFPPGETPGPQSDPVDLRSSAGEIHSLGLALMYRLPYRRLLGEAVPPDHRRFDEPDFTEALFGYQRENSDDDGARGRVSFGPLACMERPEPLPAVITALGAPKPTYYPNYITQNEVTDPATGRLKQIQQYHTLMDNGARLRGWKFFPARRDHGALPEPPLPPRTGDSDTPSFEAATAFEPLPAGTRFRGRLRFHNLRPEELGAILWALTWGGNTACRHRLGMAKPLGYGCARITITSHQFHPNDPDQPAPSPGDLVAAFETWSRNECPGWIDGPDIREDLLGMARHDHGRDTTLRYPRLTVGGPNDFTKFKGSHRDRIPSFALRRWRDIAAAPPPAPGAGPSAEAPRPHRGQPSPGGGRSRDRRPDRPDRPDRADRQAGPGRGRDRSNRRGRDRQAGPPHGSATPRRISVGRFVRCEVLERDPDARSARFTILDADPPVTGGLHPDATTAFHLIPEPGRRLDMIVASIENGAVLLKPPGH